MKLSNPSRKLSRSLIAALACAGFGAGSLILGSTAAEEKNPVVSLPKFKTPPGKAKRKGTNATRSGDKPVIVRLLTPETYGATYSAQPALFWYQSDSSKPGQIVFSIREESGKEQLAKVALRKSYPKGVNRLDLSSLKVRLEEGKSYSWAITYVTSRKAPSLNGLCKGVVKVTPMPASVEAAISGKGAEERAAIYAENGAWHELLESLEGRPEFDRLLKEVGLAEIIE